MLSKEPRQTTTRCCNWTIFWNIVSRFRIFCVYSLPTWCLITAKKIVTVKALIGSRVTVKRKRLHPQIQSLKMFPQVERLWAIASTAYILLQCVPHGNTITSSWIYSWALPHILPYKRKLTWEAQKPMFALNLPLNRPYASTFEPAIKSQLLYLLKFGIRAFYPVFVLSIVYSTTYVQAVCL